MVPPLGFVLASSAHIPWGRTYPLDFQYRAISEMAAIVSTLPTDPHIHRGRDRFGCERELRSLRSGSESTVV